MRYRIVLVGAGLLMVCAHTARGQWPLPAKVVGTKCDQKDRIERLICRLGSRKRSARKAAVGALKRAGPKIIPTLEVALSDKHEEVRSARLEGLREHRTKTRLVKFAVRGPLRRASVRAQIKGSLDKVARDCGVASGSRFSLLIIVEPKGEIRTCEKRRSTIGDEATEQCVLAHFTKLRFRATARASRIVATIKVTDTWVPASPIPVVHRRVNHLAIVEVLGSFGPRAIPSLTRCLGHPFLDVNREAAVELGKMGPKAAPAISALIRALDTDMMTRSWISGALADIGQKAVPSLVKALRHKKPTVRIGASAALEVIWTKHKSGLRDKAAVLAFNQALQDPNLEVRKAAARALATFGPLGSSTIPGIKRLLEEKEDAAVQQATTALGGMGAAGTPALIQALKHKRHRVRLWSALTLGFIKPIPRVAEPVLIALLNDPNARVARVAAGTLGRIGSKSPLPIELLRRALQDKKSDVREEGAQALGEFGRRAIGAVRDLRRRLKDPDRGVRKAAAKALRKIRGRINKRRPQKGKRM